MANLVWQTFSEIRGFMDNYKRAALFQYPDEIPTSVSVLPAGWMKYRVILR